MPLATRAQSCTAKSFAAVAPRGCGPVQISGVEADADGSEVRWVTKEDLVVAFEVAIFRRNRAAALRSLRELEPGRDVPVGHVVRLARLLRGWRELVQLVSALPASRRAPLLGGLLATGSLRRGLLPVGFALLSHVEDERAKAPHVLFGVVVASELDEAFLEVAKGEGLRRTAPDLAHAVREYLRSALAGRPVTAPTPILQAELSVGGGGGRSEAAGRYRK